MIGNIQYIHGVFKIRYGFSENGKCFKDEGAYKANMKAPCYAPESAFDDEEEIKDNFYTHKDLLEECGYNEELCDAMFSSLSWQSPDVWTNELDSDDFAQFWDWLEVGKKAYWWISDWWEPGFYEVEFIESPKEEWSYDTMVILRREDEESPGEYETIDARLWDLAKTDIREKYE